MTLNQAKIYEWLLLTCFLNIGMSMKLGPGQIASVTGQTHMTGNQATYNVKKVLI